MIWEHSEDTRNHWKEQMEQALREGKLTTIITFDNVTYSVTLQPYTTAFQTLEERRLGADLNPVDKTRPYQHEQCICGADLTWYVGKQKWDHTKRDAVGHIPQPTAQKRR